MGIDIQRKRPQAWRQQREKGLKIRQPLGQGKVEQYRAGRCHKRRCGLGGRGFAALDEGGVQFSQSKAGILDAAQGEIGVGIEQTGGKPCSRVGAVEIGLGLPGRRLRTAGEIVILCQGNIPLRPL